MRSIESKSMFWSKLVLVINSFLFWDTHFNSWLITPKMVAFSSEFTNSHRPYAKIAFMPLLVRKPFVYIVPLECVTFCQNTATSKALTGSLTMSQLIHILNLWYFDILTFSQAVGSRMRRSMEPIESINPKWVDQTNSAAGSTLPISHVSRNATLYSFLLYR